MSHAGRFFSELPKNHVNDMLRKASRRCIAHADDGDERFDSVSLRVVDQLRSLCVAMLVGLLAIVPE